MFGSLPYDVEMIQLSPALMSTLFSSCYVSRGLETQPFQSLRFECYR